MHISCHILFWCRCLRLGFGLGCSRHACHTRTHTKRRRCIRRLSASIDVFPNEMISRLLTSLRDTPHSPGTCTCGGGGLRVVRDLSGGAVFLKALLWGHCRECWLQKVAWLIPFRGSLWSLRGCVDDGICQTGRSWEWSRLFDCSCLDKKKQAWELLAIVGLAVWGRHDVCKSMSEVDACNDTTRVGVMNQ
jgi:hypothetical protein